MAGRLSRFAPGLRGLFLLVSAYAACGSVHAEAVNNKLVSRAAGEAGAAGNAESANSHITPDGRYVVFRSSASTLVPGGSSTVQVYLRDLKTNAIEVVSLNPLGLPGNGASYQPQLSADARYIVFTSAATDLVAGDTNGFDDVFCRDRQTGTTQRISVVPAALGGGEANNPSFQARITGDGRFILFESRATNLIAADTNDMSDGFLWDRSSGNLERVTVSSTGGELSGSFLGRNEAPALSDDGRFIVFQTDFGVTNAVPGDTNNSQDVFLRDRTLGTTTRISVSAQGVEGNAASFFPTISRDGGTIVFASYATNLIAGALGNVSNIYLFKRTTGALSRITNANGDSHQATTSTDGRFVAFSSDASNLVDGDTNNVTDQFLYDSTTGAISMISRASDGQAGNNRSGSHEIAGQALIFGFPAFVSDDGRYVSFDSDATNLVVDDANSATDVFVHDGQPTTIARAGGNKTVFEGTPVTLDGSGSSGVGLAFAWNQTSGPPIALPGAADQAAFSFVAPQVDATTPLAVRLVVTDALGVVSFDTATITVVDSSGGSQSDSDGDGFPDQLEFIAGTDPLDPASKPQPLTITKLKMKANFAVQNKDSASATGTVLGPAGFALANLPVTISMANTTQKFALDASGRTPKGKLFRAKFKKPAKGQSFPGGTVAVSLGLRGASFAEPLDVPNETTRSGQTAVPIVLILGTTPYAATVPASFKAVKDKTAAIKK